MSFPLTRQEAISLRNTIASARRAASLKPFSNPTPTLQKHRPQTPPFTILTTEDGVRIRPAWT